MKTFPKPLTAEEEKYYLQRHKEGDEKARQILIEYNLRLVAHIVKKYQTSEDDMEELISIGTVGLIKAVDTFNHEKASKLATYAARCVENEILMYLRKNGAQKTEVSLDEPLNTDYDGNELLLSDILGTDADEVIRPLEDDAEAQMLMAAIETLCEREKRIILMRFGFLDGMEYTQKEVADQLGISQSYISRLEKRILSRLHVDLARFSS